MKAGWFLLLTACDAFYGLSQQTPSSDAITDVTSADAAACWPFAASNYDPCADGFATMYPSKGDFAVTGPLTIDTDTDTALGYAYAGGVELFHFDAFSVQAGMTLTIQGSRPALIVAEGKATIFGTIEVKPTAALDTKCVSSDAGDTNTNCSPGGGGGGYTSPGGSSGSGCSGSTSGGGINGTPDLVPLRGGCPGGHSGHSNVAGGPAVPGAGGGSAGGALEISARDRVDVVGDIFADGDGGGGGGAATANSTQCPGQPQGHDCDSGGGGGGAGGSILLEGETVSIEGMVCAVGGGGGAGGANGNKTGAGGMDAAACTPGIGGANPAATAGGVGGGSAAPTSGGDGSVGGFTSSGGGGGSVGRIHVHSVQTPTLGGTTVPSPG